MYTAQLFEAAHLQGNKTPIPLPGKLEVQLLRWSVYGGSDIAELEFVGSPAGWSLLFESLGRHIEVSGPDGQACWAGYIHEVSLSTGSASYRISLDNTWNKVAVRVGAVDTSTGEPQDITTPWYTDEASVSRFGYREKIFSAMSQDPSTAQKQAQLFLSLYAFPRLSLPEFVPSTKGARVLCKGYFHVLEARYYENSSFNQVDTAQQIKQIVDNFALGGNFPIGGARIFIPSNNDQSGILEVEQRDGSASPKEIIEGLLKEGTVYGLPMRARIDPETLYMLIEETESPSATSPNYMIKPNGTLAAITGEPLMAHMLVPGSAIYIDLPSPLANTTIKNIAVVESVTWEPARVSLTPLNEQTTLQAALGIEL